MKQRGNLQRKKADNREHKSVLPIVHEVLASEGQPLDAETRAFMEPRFGHDFGQVRVHTGARATPFVQPKLVLGQPKDRYEQEAEHIADSIIDLSAPSVRQAARQSAEEAVAEEWPSVGDRLVRAFFPQITAPIQCQSVEGVSTEVQPDVEASITSMGSNGNPLPSMTRHFFESRFGRNFSQVRIHTDDRAALAARALGARAFTFGNHVMFAAGQYLPDTMPGRQLLAHELVHTIQQGNVENPPSVSLRLSRTPEQLWFEANPEPRFIEEGRRLIVWNFPIDSSRLHVAHSNVIQQFLNKHRLAWLHSGSHINIIGRASESGPEAQNRNLSWRRARAVQELIDQSSVPPSVELRASGRGEGEPLAHGSEAENMAINRSVEIAIVVPSPQQVPAREQRWRFARHYLETVLNTTVGADADLIWTPTSAGLLRMLPRIPLFEDAYPDHYGSNVPTNTLCSDRPASSCMPGPPFESRKVLGEELERSFRLNHSLNDRQIQEVVHRVILEAERASETRTRRLNELELKLVQGGGPMISEDIRRYLRAEQEYFYSDPTCLIRYVR